MYVSSEIFFFIGYGTCMNFLISFESGKLMQVSSRDNVFRLFALIVCNIFYKAIDIHLDVIISAA